jgi:hypothetical protein
VVPYGGEILSLTLREETLRVFENRMLRRIFGPKRDEVRGGWMDNIKMDLREIGWDGMDRIDLAQDREQWRGPVNTVMNLWVP